MRRPGWDGHRRRTGLTDVVADPAQAKDEVNAGAWKLHEEHQD
jgi:hypothetical protein